MSQNFTWLSIQHADMFSAPCYFINRLGVLLLLLILLSHKVSIFLDKRGVGGGERGLECGAFLLCQNES